MEYYPSKKTVRMRIRTTPKGQQHNVKRRREKRKKKMKKKQEQNMK